MKNRKVLNLRTHLGGWLGQTSYDAEQHKCEMELTPAGVLIKTFKGEPLKRNGKLVYCLSNNSNNIETIIEAVDDDDVGQTKESIEKRGPGRPAKE